MLVFASLNTENLPEVAGQKSIQTDMPALPRKIAGFAYNIKICSVFPKPQKHIWLPIR